MYRFLFVLFCLFYFDVGEIQALECGWECSGGGYSCKQPNGATETTTDTCSDGSEGICVHRCEGSTDKWDTCGGNLIQVKCSSGYKSSSGCCGGGGGGGPPPVTPTPTPQPIAGCIRDGTKPGKPGVSGVRVGVTNGGPVAAATSWRYGVTGADGCFSVSDYIAAQPGGYAVRLDFDTVDGLDYGSSVNVPLGYADPKTVGTNFDTGLSGNIFGTYRHCFSPPDTSGSDTPVGATSYECQRLDFPQAKNGDANNPAYIDCATGYPSRNFPLATPLIGGRCNFLVYSLPCPTLIQQCETEIVGTTRKIKLEWSVDSSWSSQVAGFWIKIDFDSIPDQIIKIDDPTVRMYETYVPLDQTFVWGIQAKRLGEVKTDLGVTDPPYVGMYCVSSPVDCKLRITPEPTPYESYPLPYDAIICRPL